MAYLLLLPSLFIKSYILHLLAALVAVAIFLIYTSYLLFYKKSYNLLAGMTEEELKKSESDIEIRLKYEKGAKIMGVISFIGGLFVLYILYSSLKL